VNTCVVLATLANALQRFEDTALVSALAALGGADEAVRTTEGALEAQHLAGQLSRVAVHRTIQRLKEGGLISTSVYPNTRTTITLSAQKLEGFLVGASELDPVAAERLVRLLHALRDYDEALVLAGMLALADEFSEFSVPRILESVEGRVDRFRVHRALKRLAKAGLVELTAVPRQGTSVVLVAPAVAEVMARPLPAVPYLSPTAFAQSPFFKRLANGLAAGSSVPGAVAAESAEAEPSAAGVSFTASA